MPAGLRPPLGHVFLSTDTVGGVWQYGLELARGLRREGVAVTLAVLGPEAGAARRAEAEQAGVTQLIETGLPLEWTAGSPEEVLEAGRRLAALCGESGADLAHLGNVAFAEAEWSVPVVATVHSCVATWWRTVRGGGPLPEDLAWRAERIRAGLERVQACIAPTAAFAEQLRQVYGLALPGLEVVHNGREPKPVAAMPRQDVVLTAGRLWDEAKDVETLDRAAALTDCPVLAAGPAEGPDGQAFAPRHLTLLGNLDEAEMAGRMAASAIFASPAVYEPFGLAVLEAARSGAALVLSDTAGFRELWGEAAVYVQPRDPQALAGAIDRLRRRPALRQQLADAGRRRAARYARERMTAGTLRAYRRAVARFAADRTAAGRATAGQAA